MNEGYAQAKWDEIPRRQTHNPHPSDWRAEWDGLYPSLRYIGTHLGWYPCPPADHSWEEVYEHNVVYLIHAPELKRVKIGQSAAPHKRLMELQVGSPARLELIAVLENESEPALHARFANRRIHGEWFEDSVLGDLL